MVKQFYQSKWKEDKKKVRGVVHMTKRLIAVFMGVALILVLCGLVYAESENYCHDKDSWK
jgi:hypothetical protein